MTTLGVHLKWAHVREVMEREKRPALFQFTEPQFFINHSLLTMTYRKIALMKSRICRQQPPGGQGQLQNCSYFGDDVLGLVILYLAQAPCLVIPPASALLVLDVRH